MVKAEATLVDEIEAILGDTSNEIFSAANDVRPAYLAGLKDISLISPYKVNHWMTARNKSRYISTATLSDLIEPNYAIWPIKLVDSDGGLISDSDLDNNRHNVEWEDGQIRLDINNYPSAQTTDTLTGTVTFSDGSTAISGSGTAFTTELRAGYYIRKSGSTNWYRIASVTDATNLVLATSCATADDGADTVSLTSYWRNDVLVNCNKVHYSTTQTDVAGAVKGATAKGSWSIVVDALGTGVMDKNIIFTIAGVDGVYRNTATATITTNEATLTIEPALLGIAADNAVVTFYPTSLTPTLEEFAVQLGAAWCCINKASEAYDGWLSITKASTGDIALYETEQALMNAEVDQSLTDNDAGRTLNPNAVHTGSNPIATYLGIANMDLNGMKGFMATAAANVTKANFRMSSANFLISLRNLGFERRRIALNTLTTLVKRPSIIRQYPRS